MKSKSALLQERLLTPGSLSNDWSSSLSLESSRASWKVSSRVPLLHLTKNTDFACLVEIHTAFVIKAAKACS